MSGQSEVLPGSAEILGNQPYPRYFLDFETIQFAVPIWEGTRPYQQLPFQWSCHVEQEPGVISHLEFLDLSGHPPMRSFAESLISACGESGPIFVYANFEARIIREMIQQHPDLAGPLEVILERIVDLLPIVQQHYYHPQMHGSWSLKAGLPCLNPELDYSSLDGVQDGYQAQVAYMEAISQDTTSRRKEEILQELSAYCKMDTLALVRIIEVLSN
ncbi:MAG: DUF2779 domain-containing protein [Thermodesulfobacteriota bacterium]